MNLRTLSYQKNNTAHMESVTVVKTKYTMGYLNRLHNNNIE